MVNICLDNDRTLISRTTQIGLLALIPATLAVEYAGILVLIRR